MKQSPRSKRLRPTRYLTVTVRSRYWRPGDDYCKEICELVRNAICDGDVVVISEKALAMAQGRICDESTLEPSGLARFITRFWMQKVWGYFLGPLTKMSRVNIWRLRKYPAEEGASHKQAAILHAGFLQALRHSSEGGIDVSNAPYYYACLPLADPPTVAQEIKRCLLDAVGVNTEVMIVDSDKTYTFRTIHLSSRRSSIKGIHCIGPAAFVLGRVLKLRPRSTPIACTKIDIDPEVALRVAAIANKARGDGAGKTVWDVAERFGVPLGGVSWEMLEQIPHRPVVIVRRLIQVNP
ncbi:MAG: coenzyme F420-0:L-glutamate ligase [Candidatus Bathyarchaeia archaeon]